MRAARLSCVVSLVALGWAFGCSRTALDDADYGYPGSAQRDGGIDTPDGAARGPDACSGGRPVYCAGKCGTFVTPCNEVVKCADCPLGEACGGSGQPNVCGAVLCVPDCAGAVCGAKDGCGGVCVSGSCSAGQQCQSGSCAQVGTVVLFGGSTKLSTTFDDTWTFDGTTWTKVADSAPPARVSVTLSALGPNVMLFGDATAGDGNPLDDTWLFDGSQWKPVKGRQPHPLNLEYPALAELGTGALLFGGFSPTSSYVSDTWTFDGSSWQSQPAVGPAARSGHAMASLNGRVILFGGYDGMQHLNDTWSFDGNAWTLLTSSGPLARSATAMATLGGNVVLFGGSDGRNDYDDTWEFDGKTWQKLDIPGPPPRDAHALATQGQRIVLFGGQDITGDLGDTWTFDGQAWTELPVTNAPSPRHYTTMATIR